MGEKMKKRKDIVAKMLEKVVRYTLSDAANSRCSVIFHQPRQPENVKKFRKF